MADRSVRVRLSATDSGFGRTFAGASAKAKAFASDLERTDQRMSGIVQTGLALGPALAPLTAVAAPAAAGLASAFGAAAVGAGAAALAFSGVGDALEAVNDYQVEPTAENLAKMRQALTELGPAGAEFVRYLQTLRPELDGLQSIARQGLFPGVEAGIEQVRTQLPLLEDIVANVSTALGGMAEAGGEALAGPFWTQFLQFIRDDAASALAGMGQGFGNIAEGLAGLTMSLDPVADDFGGALLRMSESFSEWGRSVGQTQDFREFVDYLHSVGPQIGDTLGAVANALVQLGQAAAPVGGIVLESIEGIAHTLAAIANIPLVGPALIGAAAGISAMSRAVALWKASGMASLVTGLRGVDAEGKKASAAMRGLGLATVGLVALGTGAAAIRQIQEATDDSIPGVNDLTNRLRDLGTGGRGLGPEFGDLDESIRRVSGSTRTFGESVADFLQTPFESLFGEAGSLRQGRADIEQLDAAFAQLVAQEGPLEARRQFVEMAKGMDPGAVQRLVGLMPQYREALEGVGTDADLAAEGLTGAQRAAQRLNAELANLSANLEKRAALRAYRDSIRQFNQTLEDGPKNLRKGTAAYDEAAGALDGIAAASVTAASHLQGMNKIRFMQQARRDFVTAAKQMDLTGGQARRLADRLGLVNQHGKIQITLRERGLDDATQKLARVKDRAEAIPERIDARVEGNTGDADRDLGVVANKMRDIDRTTASPKARLDDDASPRINAVRGLMQALAGSDATPSANLRDNASGGISHISGLLAALDGRTANTTVTNTVINRTISIGSQGGRRYGGAIPEADGGIVERYDTGGMRDLPPIGSQPPQIQPNHGSRGIMWAETGAGPWEAFVSGHPDKRARSIDIWREVGDRLGVQFREMAEGGILRFADGGGFIGGATPITSGYIESRLDVVEPLPSLRAYNRALEERARAYRALGRERRQLTRQNQQAKDATKDLAQVERELDKYESKKDIRRELRENVQSAEAAERVLHAEKSSNAEKREARKELAQLTKRRDKLSESEQRVIKLLERQDRLADRSKKQTKQAEQAEKELEKAKDRHAKAQQRVTEAMQDYSSKQQQAIDDARQAAEGLAGTADIFGGFLSPRGAQRAVDQVIENVAEYGQMMATFRARRVHPWLLAQFQAQGPTEAGLRLGRALLRDPQALARLSTSAGALGELSERVGAMTADPRFMGGGAWNPTGAMSTRALNVQIRALDISQVSGEIRRQVQHVVRAELAAGIV